MSYMGVIVTKYDNSRLLYLWGSNLHSQLATNAVSSNSIKPILVNPSYFNSPIKQVALGAENPFVLLDNNSVYVWGNNQFGQLGNGSVSSTNTHIPTKINPSYFGNKKIVAISAGYRTFAVVTDDGNAYMWGMNHEYQVGSGSNNDPVKIPQLIRKTNIGSRIISRVFLGAYVQGLLCTDGSIFMWGYNGNGECGLPASSTRIVVPTLVNTSGFSGTVQDMSIRGYHSLVLLSDGSILAWGQNSSYQLGDGTKDSRHNAKIVDIPSDSKAIKVEAGPDFSSVLFENGDIYMWGGNGSGALATGDFKNVPTPRKVSINSHKTYIPKDLMLYASSCMIISEDMKFLMWGTNSSNQLGIDKNIVSNYVLSPMWMPNIGKDSHIIANSSFTAREAARNMWVDNKFNVEGFNKSFIIRNIPDVDDQEFTMTIKPTGSDKTTSVTMNIGIKYFYDENGLRVDDTAASPMTISDFMPSLTNIYPKASPKNDIVIDRWLESLKDTQGHIDRVLLEEYLQLDYVPQDAVFTIKDLKQDLATGKITFNIISSKTVNENMDESGESDPFPITLNLTARVTKVATRTNYNKIVVNKLKDLIFDEAGFAKISEINKYLEITAPVDGAILNLKPNSYVIDTGMGTTKFTVFYDKYYDTNGVEQTQTPASIKQSFDISLDLLPMASVITSKPTYTPTHRVDRFMTAFSDANGKVTNETILKQYIDIENMPTGYSLSIKDYNIIDPIAGTVSFTVVASNYNDLNFEPQTNGEFPIQLLQLLPKFPTTDISAKTEADYDDTVRLDRFVPLFADEATGVVNNINKLGEFLDLVSIPENATLTVKNIKMTNAIGKITFDIEVSKYYDADSDLQNATKSFSIELNLGIKYIPTEITANKNIVYPERVDRFETEIKKLSGTPELQTYLQSKYITIVGDLPKNTTFSVDNIVGVNETGIINFDLTASAFYDENSDRIENKVIPLELSLRIKYAPTVLTAKAKEDYTAQDRVDRFEHNVKMFKDQDLKTYLSNYVDGINTLVVGSTLVASAVTSEITTGAISFSLTTNKYYDADSDLQVSDTTWTIALELGIKHEQTKVTSKTGDFTHIVVDQFIPLFTDEQLVVDDKTELNKYVDITALPADANLSVKDANMTFSTGMIIFKIVADKFYDGESDLITTFSQEYIIKLTLGIKYQATTVSAIKGYDQSENVETFANQIKTLTGDALKTYLDTYLQIKGDLPADAILSVDVDSITTDLETGKVSFNVQLDKYYDETGSLQSNGSFTIKLKLAF